MGRKIAIIGAAATGVSVLGHIVHTANSDVDSITLIDPRPPGRGPVFSCDDPLLLCNTPTWMNSLLVHEPGDFLGYLARCGQPATADTYVARDVVGEYTRTRYQEYVQAASALGIEVRHHAARADSIRCGKVGGYEIRLNQLPCIFDQVIICVGFGAPVIPDGFGQYMRHPRLAASPYPVTDLRERVYHGSRVLVLGAGQSAIDAALVMCRDGHQVTMASRSGILPAVRARLLSPSVSLPSLARMSRLDASDPHLPRKLARILLEALRATAPIPLRRQICPAADPVQRLRDEAGLATAGQLPWQDIILPVLDEITNWTAPMLPAVRTSLLSPYRAMIWRYINAMVLENAQRLLRNTDAGHLRVTAYQPGQVAAHGVGFDVGTSHGGPERFDFVVNAAGYRPPDIRLGTDTVYLTDPPSGAAVLDHLGKDLRIRFSPGAPPEQVWLVGLSTHLRVPFPSYFRGAVVQAASVARQLPAALRPEERERNGCY